MMKNKGTESEEASMGFKDKQKALDTLKILDGRDISYQYHVILTFISRAKRTLQITKDEEKVANLKEALKVFEDWLTDYKTNNRSKENLAYLPLETIKGFRSLARKYDVLDDTFFTAYKKEKGDYKNLRNVKTDKDLTWDIVRNKKLKEIVNKIKENRIQWYETDIGDYRGFPTKEHTQCIMLGYSPDPTKIKKLISQVEEKFGIEDDIDIDIEDEDKGTKRSHENSSSSENEEEPPNKVLKETEESLGFKDKEKALKSIELLKEKNTSYQYRVIVGLVKRAERVISCTKDQTKIDNMKEAVKVFENWITDYKLK